MILLVDNYDSFSYNLFQLVGELEPEIRVIRNDEMSVEQVRELHPAGIILSPGPGRPEDAGICVEIVQKLKGEIPILGVCLGHQSICLAYGATVGYARELMHGKSSMARIDQSSGLFQGLEEEIQVARYHSLAAEADTVPETLKITARTADGSVMAVEAVSEPVYGLQFHPESILTPKGRVILKNYLEITRSFRG